MTGEDAPEILSHLKDVTFPSGSVDRLPSNVIKSMGSLISVSFPAFAIGGLLLSKQFSQDNSRLQEFSINQQQEKQITMVVIAFITFDVIVIPKSQYNGYQKCE